MKATHGEDVPTYDSVKHWYCQFKCGQTSVTMALTPGPPQSAIDEDTIRQMEAAILEDCCITVHQLAQDIKISVGSVEKVIPEHLHMQKLLARWIPRLLTPCQKQERVSCTEALLTLSQKTNRLFNRLNTQDQTARLCKFIITSPQSVSESELGHL